MGAFVETGYAKINLALHVRGRLATGYHDLETLFAFAESGDRISAEVADRDMLTITGEFADGLSNGLDNLLLQALASLRHVGPDIPFLAISLEKNLPVAAGVGGGSADAAALIRLVNRHFLHFGADEALIGSQRHLGADVGACIISKTRLGFGTGDDLRAVEADDINAMPILLVNPRIALSTGPVFAAWDGVDRGPLAPVSALAMAKAGRNDLEHAAIALVPEIRDILDILKQQAGTEIARMSGSGATCFALYSSPDARDDAQRAIAKACPDWWTMASCVR
jgi:4-diphosphocytidyl-2-C-methyl-D-erythritol kinase